MSPMHRFAHRHYGPRLALTLFALAAACFAMAFLGGCASLGGPGTDRGKMLTKAVQAEEVYISTVTVLKDYRRQGVITDDAYRTIEQWRSVAAASIDSAKAAALAEDRSAFGQATAALQEAMEHLLAYRVRAQQNRGSP